MVSLGGIGSSSKHKVNISCNNNKKTRSNKTRDTHKDWGGEEEEEEGERMSFFLLLREILLALIRYSHTQGGEVGERAGDAVRGGRYQPTS
jgi:hypothetical protein